MVSTAQTAEYSRLDQNLGSLKVLVYALNGTVMPSDTWKVAMSGSTK